MQGFHAPDVKDARSLPGILLFILFRRRKASPMVT
jgi:hypothetical protein